MGPDMEPQMPFSTAFPARRWARVLVVTALSALGQAQAYVECTVTPKKYYIG
jgi:hypothetical protein